MPQVVNQNMDGDQIYAERLAIVANHLAEINRRLDSPTHLEESYIEYFGSTVKSACTIKDLVDEVTNVVFKAQKHFTAIGQLDFWRSQLMRLRIPIADFIDDAKKRNELNAKINMKYLFVDAFNGDPKKIQQAYDNAIKSLEEDSDNELTLLTRLEFHNALVSKADIRKLVGNKDKFHHLFEEAKTSKNPYAQKHAYAMMARYYERIGEGQAIGQSFNFALEAFLNIYFVHQDRGGLSNLGIMANYAIAHGLLDYAETLLNTWARYREGYTLDSLYNDAVYLGARGHLHYKRGNYEAARRCLNSANQLYRQLKHDDNMGRTLLFLGLTYNKLNAYDLGLTVYQTARSVYETLEKDEYVIRAEHGMGWTHMNMGNHSQAIQLLEGALTKAEQSFSDTLVGTIYCLKEDLAKARASI